MDLHVLPECYIDTKLVKVLVPPQKRYNHQKGTNVLRKMKKELADQFALGIVDEDVEEREYSQSFQLVYEVTGCLKLLKHTHRHHYLIYLCPEIEEWIIARAEEAQISLTTFGLPHDLDKLSTISKTSKSEENDPYSENFKQLFRELKRSNIPTVELFKFWISYLKSNPYSVDIPWLLQESERLLNDV